MAQVLLFPDPRPLVERLGMEFFRQAPSSPGVYLMRDVSETVLYVGKAKNLRKRLASYRVANPDRLPRRHLRMLRAVARIELRECADESAALATESELLRELRPSFNRAGTWRGPPRFLGWRVTPEGMELTVRNASEAGWHWVDSLGAGAFYARACLIRLLWCALHPERGLAGLPQGWFRCRRFETMLLPCPGTDPDQLGTLASHLAALFDGRIDEFTGWIQARTANQIHPFEIAAREADLEALVEFAPGNRSEPAGNS